MKLKPEEELRKLYHETPHYEIEFKWKQRIFWAIAAIVIIFITWWTEK